MLLSIDWDAYSGTRELVFDAPIWGTRDHEHDRLEAWRERTRKRGGVFSQGGAGTGGAAWKALDADFPLYDGWQALTQYAGRPAFVMLSHADIWPVLERFAGPVLNIDSHHDLASRSGDAARLRPGNWAGLGLRAGLVSAYECRYPQWHAALPVAEGYDLARTHAEIAPLLLTPMLERVRLTRSAALPPPAEVSVVALVQSPAWTNPAHDAPFFALAEALAAEVVSEPLRR